MELNILVSGVFSALMEQLAPIYTATSGTGVAAELAPSMGDSPDSIPHRLGRGDAADVVIMVQPDLASLESHGAVQGGSVVELAKASIAMAVPFGASVPDISTEDGLRRALLAAGSIAVSESASGVYVNGALLERLGIGQQAAGKVRVVKGRAVGAAVAQGEFDICFQQLAELMLIERIQIAGLFPNAVQHQTVVAGAVGAFARNPTDAASFVAFLAQPSFQVLFSRNGLQPPPVMTKRRV